MSIPNTFSSAATQYQLYKHCYGLYYLFHLQLVELYISLHLLPDSRMHIIYTPITLDSHLHVHSFNYTLLYVCMFATLIQPSIQVSSRVNNECGDQFPCQ